MPESLLVLLPLVIFHFSVVPHPAMLERSGDGFARPRLFPTIIQDELHADGFQILCCDTFDGLFLDIHFAVQALHRGVIQLGRYRFQRVLQVGMGI